MGRKVDLSFGCDKKISKAIHYPECWDTLAYPTLASALWEMTDRHIFKFKCPVCRKEQGDIE